MAFGCTEFCWWLQGYFALTSSAELTDVQEREILSNLRKARQSIDPYDHTGVNHGVLCQSDRPDERRLAGC